MFSFQFMFLVYYACYSNLGDSMIIDYFRIGQEIKSKRKALKITQEMLAEKVGISCVYVSKIENGNANLTVAVLMKIAVLLDLNPGYLLSGNYYDPKDNLSDFTLVLKKCSPKTLNTLKAIAEVLIKNQ